ncbi:hypothetical protein MUK42_27087 [Musa troglodytarum]|uniref:Uncharacterized protein n=1 Tax=Musa troglodytarum TaxID=320322 RepID=A0A9E7K0F3_9LILI|nr:hypothetical protein MUK42_27087 [Musa troglodytarum]
MLAFYRTCIKYFNSSQTMIAFIGTGQWYAGTEKLNEDILFFGIVIVIDHISEKVFGSLRITVIPRQGDLPSRHPLLGGISQGRRKKKENKRQKKREHLEIRRHSPSIIPIHRCPLSPNATDEMLPPPRLRRQGLSIVDDVVEASWGDLGVVGNFS